MDFIKLALMCKNCSLEISYYMLTIIYNMTTQGKGRYCAVTTSKSSSSVTITVSSADLDILLIIVNALLLS